jgi:hypothetical protein
MCMRMIRSFNPVGQGAFYTEKFIFNKKEYNFVFDCGSVTDRGRCIKKEIEANFMDNEEIEAVFISHCDEDHINGLDKLLKKCSIKKLFLPLIKDQNKALLIMKSYARFGIRSGSLIERLLDNPRDLINDDDYRVEQVILVNEISEERVSQGEDKKRFSINENIGDEIDSDSELVLECGNISIWKFVMTNFNENRRIAELINAFTAEGIRIPQNADEMVEIWMNNSKKIIDIYQRKSKVKITGDVNTNSLVVFSGKDDENVDVDLLNFHKHGYYSMYDIWTLNSMKSGCMYMGDYDANGSQKWKWIEDVYGREWKEINIWQLPHHGSWRNFNEKLTSHDANVYIACAGTTNQHHHPSGMVIKKLLLGGKKVYWVNENIGTRVDFVYEIFKK